ncbi:MAG: hypothetical protein EBU90_04880 [Proteobacteria bacterium]|nr:hypothetical protein [Pseudomonadota bacterium]NBP13747.1 hypothetical protein [bacterium]
MTNISQVKAFDQMFGSVEQTIVQTNSLLKPDDICYDFVPKRTTMTVLMVGNTSIGDHRLNEFKEWYTDTHTTNDLFLLTSHRKFHNCVILKRHLNHRVIAVKVFSNGKLHLTGTTTMEQALGYGLEVTDILKEFTGEDFGLSTFSPQLINYRLKLNVPEGMVLCLKSMFNFWQKHSDVPVFFNIEHYPGIRIKLAYDNHVSTVLIFESGSVLLNAVVSADELEFVHGYIVDSIRHMTTEISCVLKPRLKKRSRDKLFCYSAFV